MKTTTVYTTTDCASCVMVKKYLTTKGVDFTVVNLDDDPQTRQKIIELSKSMTVPITIIEDEAGNQNITVGWNPSKLAMALAA